ncbi:uncharacterized protein LOC106176581 [Lingula anatina]|uniref:Uncharacterized protein LOC106176581 n=1 Tax=Lingula anatina TaxID=7574 RepID=A0A1S3JW35_LINAN|nr:uncharacterized protein LOC106176581 [Lingula anatina]XP_013414507.1 uncharacterized protein LOC106176581 [Lingula anatina]|eukprot:XP_013414506.1 uncharacterized protein LOC106176581 [Lingula anatina]
MGTGVSKSHSKSDVRAQETGVHHNPPSPSQTTITNQGSRIDVTQLSSPQPKSEHEPSIKVEEHRGSRVGSNLSIRSKTGSLNRTKTGVATSKIDPDLSSSQCLVKEPLSSEDCEPGGNKEATRRSTSAISRQSYRKLDPEPAQDSKDSQSVTSNQVNVSHSGREKNGFPEQDISHERTSQKLKMETSEVFENHSIHRDGEVSAISLPLQHQQDQGAHMRATNEIDDQGDRNNKEELDEVIKEIFDNFQDSENSVSKTGHSSSDLEAFSEAPNANSEIGTRKTGENDIEQLYQDAFHEDFPSDNRDMEDKDAQHGNRTQQNVDCSNSKIVQQENLHTLENFGNDISRPEIETCDNENQQNIDIQSENSEGSYTYSEFNDEENDAITPGYMDHENSIEEANENQQNIHIEENTDAKPFQRKNSEDSYTYSEFNDEKNDAIKDGYMDYENSSEEANENKTEQSRHSNNHQETGDIEKQEEGNLNGEVEDVRVDDGGSEKMNLKNLHKQGQHSQGTDEKLFSTQTDGASIDLPIERGTKRERIPSNELPNQSTTQGSAGQLEEEKLENTEYEHLNKQSDSTASASLPSQHLQEEDEETYRASLELPSDAGSKRSVEYESKSQKEMSNKNTARESVGQIKKDKTDYTENDHLHKQSDSSDSASLQSQHFQEVKEEFSSAETDRASFYLPSGTAIKDLIEDESTTLKESPKQKTSKESVNPQDENKTENRASFKDDDHVTEDASGIKNNSPDDVKRSRQVTETPAAKRRVSRKDRAPRERRRKQLAKSPARTLPSLPPENHPRKLVLAISLQGDTTDPWELYWDGKNLPAEMFEDTHYHPPNIDLKDHFIESIPDEIEAFADTLTVVNFKGNNLSKLPLGFFRLKNLKKLNLSVNCFTEISKEFEKLTALEDLVMSHNYIENVDGNGPPILQTLDLSHNCTLSHGELFYSLLDWQSLSTLNLAGNQIEKIPDNISDLEELLELNVSFNELTEIPGELFELESLQSLDLSHNFIKKVGEPSLDSQLERLDVSANYLEAIPLSTHFKKLKHFKCSNNYIEKVQHSLSYCSSLEYVDLSENYITIFDLAGETLPSLDQLILDENYLQDFPKDVSALQNIRVLSCKRNVITFLDVPKEIISLEELYLNDNSISGVHTFLPRGLPSLKLLDVSNNQIKHLPGSFSEFEHLETLNLNGNKFIHFPDILRNGLPRLTNLALDGSKDMLHELEDQSLVLNCSGRMKDLHLAHHELEAIPDTLATLTNIERLNVSGNKLKKLPKRLLMNMSKLKHLDLSHNEFDQVPQEFRSQTNEVTHLDLQGNKISALPIHFSKMKTVEELHIGRNALCGLPPKFIEMKDITKLQLSHNPFSNVPCVIWKLQHLQHLEMNNCQLKIFDVDRSATSIHHNLRFLDVGSNQLEEIDESVVLCTSLEECEFSHNNISEIDDIPIGELTALQKLDMSYNAFDCFPTKVFECSALEQLDLSNNKIDTMEEGNVDPKNNIRILNLSFNKLQGIPVALKHLRRLEKLDIKDNRIEKISDKMEDGIPRLKSINISNNKLQFIPKTVGMSTRQLDHCSLTNNKIQDISSWEARSAILQLDLNDLHALPEALMGKQGLRDLHVMSNKLQELTFPRNRGRSCMTLQSLNVSHNHSENLANSSPFNMRNGIAVLQFLLELEIDGLRLNSLPDDIGDLKYLRKLTVRGNNLTTVPACVSRLRRLKYLDMSDNNLTEPTTKEMEFLLTAIDICEVNMSRNKLTCVPLPAKQELKSKLERFFLSDNQISVIDRLITELSYMKELHLDSNKLKYVPERVFYNKALQKLTVNKNCITAIHVPEAEALEDSSLKVLEVSNNKLTEVDSSLALFGRLESLDLSYNNISKLPPNAGLFAKLKMRGLVLTGNPALQTFAEEVLRDYLTKTDAVLKAKQGVKLFFHGRQTKDMNLVAGALMHKTEDENSSPQTLDGIAVPFNFDLDNFQVSAFICNSDFRYTVQQLASTGTIHVIVFNLDDFKDEDTSDVTFTTQISCFISEVTASMPFPILRVVAVNKSFRIDSDPLRRATGRVEDQLRSFAASLNERLLSKTALPEGSKSALKRAEHVMDMWNMPSSVTCVSVEHIEDEIRDIQDDLRDVLSHELSFPRPPVLGDLWVFFLGKLFERRDEETKPVNYLTRHECISIAKECGIADDQINRFIDTFLYHLHETGKAFCLEEDGEVRMIFTEKERYLDMLSCVLSSKNPELSSRNVQQLLDKANRWKFSAVDVIYVLNRMEYLVQTTPETHFCPALAKTPGAAAVLKKLGDIKKVKSSNEEIQIAAAVTSIFPFGAFFQLQYNIFHNEKLQVKDGSINIKSDGVWGECNGCKFFLSLQNTEDSAKYGFYNDKTVFLIRIQGEVEDDAYDHGIQTVYQHKTLEKRREVTADDGFSEVVKVLDAIFDSLEKVKLKYPGISYRTGEVRYILGDPPDSINFGDRVTRLVSRKLGGDWKEFANQLPLDADKKQKVLRAAQSKTATTDMDRTKLLLKEWKKISGKKADVINLCKALRACNNGAVADKVDALVKSHGKLRNEPI